MGYCKPLERLARASGVVAACFLALIGIAIFSQIIARLLGIQIPGADDFSAWFMAASIFLALPYAMLHGDHIRVTLLLQFLPTAMHKPYEIFATCIGFSLAVWGAWEAAHFVYESYAYNELAQGMVAVPLWIPQIPMPIGLILFAAMLIRRLFMVVRNISPEESAHE